MGDVARLQPFGNAADADRWVLIHNIVAGEAIPYRGDLSGQEYSVRNNHVGIELDHYMYTDGGVDVGYVVVGLFTDGSNDHLGWVQIGVLPQHRRNGIGRTLATKALELVVAGGRTSITFDTVNTVPAGIAFAEAVGADPALREHVSVVDTSDLDWSMLEAWLEAGPRRAPGYDLISWEDDIPEEFYSELARLFRIGEEDMPLDDLDFRPMVESADTVKERLERTRGVVRRVTAVVRHRESGRLVGFSELVVTGQNTATLQTTLTVVDRNHRGSAIGKWVKSGAILQALRRFPEAERIVTDNAASNAPMLGINELIGFRPRYEIISWQTTTIVAARYLGS
jgi:GNAT superfamily N-acetyltransferase